MKNGDHNHYWSIKKYLVNELYHYLVKVLKCKKSYEVQNINIFLEMTNTAYHATDVGGRNKMILFVTVDNNK